MKSNALLAGGSVLALSMAPALAADFTERFEGREPAVSGINAKVEGGYTWIDIGGVNADLWHGAGAVSVPIGQQFGLQVDAGVGRFGVPGAGSATLAGAAAHLFWRDPAIGLIGLYGDGVGLWANTGGGGSLSLWRYGVEAELYLDRISIEGFVGGDHVRGGGATLNTFSGEAMAAFYATDNIRVHGGIGQRFEQTYGRVGGEAILPFASNNVAVFADASFSRNVTTVGGGMRVYFGEAGKSLIDRHRKDDPRIDLFDGFQFLPTGGSPPPPPPPDDSCCVDDD